MVVASIRCMALPYPLEVETKSLSGPPPRPGPPLPLRELAAEALSSQGNELFAFGHPLVIEGTTSSQQSCEELRKTLVRRMEERLPFATKEHWARLSKLMNAQLDDGDSASRAAHLVVSTVDSM